MKVKPIKSKIMRVLDFPTFGQKERFYMRRCLDLAKMAAWQRNFPVGSLMVKNDEIVAEGQEEGSTRRDVTFHAEIVAVRGAIAALETQDLSDCTLYTTHEPCVMCSYVIRQARISRVVIGLSTGEIGGASSNYPVLTATDIQRWAAPPELTFGVLTEQCQELQTFLKQE